uniref:C2H2-type domain-containing protein n=1 Tax=Timema tahoe TaxID=61484 RepID=A0A7R9IEF7_9NEOP|nr:unnamed protein product [Timema tahoe]
MAEHYPINEDTETSESTDTTNTSLNHPSTSQQENFVPCLIDVEAKDSNHSINFTPHKQWGLLLKGYVRRGLLHTWHEQWVSIPAQNKLRSTRDGVSQWPFSIQKSRKEVILTRLSVRHTFPTHRCVKKVTQSDGSVRYQCTFCKKTYCGKSYLKKHLILHTREKLYGHSISDKQLANDYMLRASLTTLPIMEGSVLAQAILLNTSMPVSTYTAQSYLLTLHI